MVDFYNARGTAEPWIKEGKHAIRWTRLSCHDFDGNGSVGASDLLALLVNWGPCP